MHQSSVTDRDSKYTFKAGIIKIKKALSVGKREEQPNMDGNLLARRIIAITVKEKANSSKGFFSRKFFIDLIAFAVQYVPIGCSRVCVFPAGFGSHFQIKYGSGSVPCSTFTGLFGFGYEFLDPWRPLIYRSRMAVFYGGKHSHGAVFASIRPFIWTCDMKRIRCNSSDSVSLTAGCVSFPANTIDHGQKIDL